MSEASSNSPPLRYVVLRHDGVPEPHYDLMFETSPGSLLRTWRAPNWPPRPGDILTPLSEHRRDYLDYEGPVSGDRGFVRRVAAGRHSVREDRRAMLVVVLDESGVVVELPR